MPRLRTRGVRKRLCQSALRRCRGRRPGQFGLSLSRGAAAWPLRHTATACTTAQRSSLAIASVSMASPRARVVSAMFSATSVGRPRRRSSSTRRRFMSSLVRRRRRRSGSVPACPRGGPRSLFPSPACSAGVAGSRLEAQGRSITMTVRSSSSRARPVLNSTATPVSGSISAVLPRLGLPTRSMCRSGAAATAAGPALQTYSGSPAMKPISRRRRILASWSGALARTARTVACAPSTS